MEAQALRNLLQQIKMGSCSVQDAMEKMAQMPFQRATEILSDTHRELRCGAPEVIFAEGKTPEQCAQAAQALAAEHQRVLLTKAGENHFAAVRDVLPTAQFHPQARCILYYARKIPKARGQVLVVCAGTSDLPIAEEACCTLEWLGHSHEMVADVGVAGLHRLLHQLERLRTADVIIAIAGMEGALPSVIAGLVASPVIAVPTDVGYGTSLQGLTALFAMLTSCAPGIGVVNINNGFGAAMLAARMLQTAHNLQG